MSATALFPGRALAPKLSLPALFALALLLDGCVFSHGTRRSNLGEEGGPRGARVTLQVAVERIATSVTGELIAVLDSSLLVYDQQGFVDVPFAVLSGSSVGGRRSRRAADEPATEALPDLDELRLLARHPYGLSRAQVTVLLEQAGQPQLVRVGPRGAHVAVALDSVDGWASHVALRAPAGHGAHIEPARAAAFDAFVDTLRVAVAALSTVPAAVAAGYRRLGPDFPGMGEHWVHPGHIVSGRVDPRAPAVLAFAPIDGAARLVGVAFTVPLAAGEQPPEHPAGRDVWHDHAGPVDEESLLLAHPASHGHDVEGARLAMFHVWVGLDNPDGITAQNNWLLPFERADLHLDDARPNADAARALSLVTSGVDYYAELFARAVRDLDAGDAPRLRDVLTERASAVAAWRAALPSDTIGAPEIGRLEDEWGTLWRDIARALPENDARALARIAGPSPGGRAALRASRPGIRSIQAGLAAGMELFASDQVAPMFGGSAMLETTSGVRLVAAYERASIDRADSFCGLSGCFSTGESAAVAVWHVGVARPVARGERVDLIATIGVGRATFALPSDDRESFALYMAAELEWRVADPVVVVFGLRDHIADLQPSDGLAHMPSLSLGLRGSWRP